MVRVLYSYFQWNSMPDRIFIGALIASSGCASDCEALKRQITCEINTCSFFKGDSFSACSASNLLGHVLCSRRAFPFYSFCVTAGFDEEEGVVHVYDAIGSKERVSVGACGNGREMLQPILDRLFSVSGEEIEIENLLEVQRDANAIIAKKQRKGMLDLSPPVKTCVDCNVEEAIALLLCGYRSVAEREISVGDDVVVCIMKRDADCFEPANDGLNGSLEVRRYPLKKH